MKNNLPVVAVVGRPNVGKSSLFNAIIKKRKSIVDPMEGVTRDINTEPVNTGRVRFYLYDTAGYLEKGDLFNQLVQQKVKAAITDAELIIFMVDGRDFHPFDEELALFLKRQDKTVWVVANKLDDPAMEEHIYEFYQLGFETVIPMSVVHKTGLSVLLESIEDYLADFQTENVAPGEIRIALAGKPNVGKSSLLNHLLGYDRSIVSEIPGTTRDSLDDVFNYQGKTIRLIDTAGLRRKSKIDDDIEYYSNVRAAQAIEASQVVIQLLEAKELISHQDKRISQMVLDKGRALVVAFNKWDQMESNNAEINYQFMKEYSKMFYSEFPAYGFVPVEFISAKDGYKIDKLMATVLKIAEEYEYRIPTGQLNEWLQTEIKESRDHHQISKLKVYYVTQVLSGPPKFVFFVNKLEHMRKDYPRFLENRLRESFGFAGTPIRISFKEKPARE